MPTPKTKQPDQKRIVAFLALKSKVPVDEMARLYEHERAELALGAHVTTFLHIFAIRNVQEVLRKRGADKQATRLGTGPALAV